jgi:hypothetical protein
MAIMWHGQKVSLSMVGMWRDRKVSFTILLKLSGEEERKEEDW